MAHQDLGQTEADLRFGMNIIASGFSEQFQLSWDL